MDTKTLVLNTKLLCIGFILHSCTPCIFGIKPDTMLIMLFCIILVNRDNFKTCMTCGIIAGLFSGITSLFPGGLFINIIEKIFTVMLVYIIVYSVKRIHPSIVFGLGTFISGAIFISIANVVVGLPLDISTMMLYVVGPAVIVNTIVGTIIFRILCRTLIKRERRADSCL